MYAYTGLQEYTDPYQGNETNQTNKNMTDKKFAAFFRNSEHAETDMVMKEKFDEETSFVQYTELNRSPN